MSSIFLEKKDKVLIGSRQERGHVTPDFRFGVHFLHSLRSGFFSGCMALVTAKREKIPAKGKLIAGWGMAATAFIWLVLIFISIDY